LCGVFFWHAGRRTLLASRSSRSTRALQGSADPGAEADLGRLFDFILEREWAREGGGNLVLAEHALVALRAGIATLQTSPFTCRKAGRSPFLRELIVPFGRSGYVVLFEIEDAANITVVAVRHQLERDYH
jgi:plasmid stabilization system protein ParE